MIVAWLRHRRWYYLLSGTLILLSIVALLLGGLKPAIEFTGGTQLAIQVVNSQANQLIEAGQRVAQTQSLNLATVIPLANNEFELTFSALDSQQKTTFLQSLQTELPQNQVSETRFETVGPSVGQELVRKTLIGIALAVGIILAYLWLQFRDWRFGLAGILAMLHDTIILTGSFAWLGLLRGTTVDVLFVTAVLTTLSFSVHDTIVIFDRVRELRRASRRTTTAVELADLAISQTLTRSLNNSITILLMLLTLFLLGGDTLRPFVLALLIGTVVGTYSSSFCALPLYADLVRWEGNS